jgi:hypothetical protein
VNYLLIIEENNNVNIKVNIQSNIIGKIHTIVTSKNSKANINLEVNIL